MEFKLDFLGIGAQKAGTTWLYEMLSQHPQINMGDEKEINFFNDKSSFNSKKIEKNYLKGMSWYKKQINPKKNKINGEISPNYLFDKKVPQRIKKHFPNTKIIVVLRNPISRAYSQFEFVSKTFHIENSFFKAIKKQPEFIQRSLYYKQLKRYYDLFKKDQIKVLFFEDIKNNPQKIIKEVEEFLKIKHFTPNNLNKKVNKTTYPRFKIINKILTKIQKIKTTKLGKKLWKNKYFWKLNRQFISIIKKINLKEGKRIQLSNKDKKYLYENYFKEDIKQLEKLLNKDLSSWKY
ncbi:MAG: sulfotransferase domain-containing protein [Nanoarchaeota archaeon]